MKRINGKISHQGSGVSMPTKEELIKLKNNPQPIRPTVVIEKKLVTLKPTPIRSK